MSDKRTYYMITENPDYGEIEGESTWEICDANDNCHTVRCDQETAEWLDIQLNKLGRLIQGFSAGGRNSKGGWAKGGKKALSSRNNGLKGGRPKEVPE